MANETAPWDGYTPPDGQMRIEGTDEIPLVTNQPVVPTERSKSVEPQTEKLMEIEPIEQTDKPEDKRWPKRPVRGRLAMPADVNAARRDVETELAQRAATEPEIPEEVSHEIHQAARRYTDELVEREKQARIARAMGKSPPADTK